MFIPVLAACHPAGLLLLTKMRERERPAARVAEINTQCTRTQSTVPPSWLFKRAKSTYQALPFKRKVGKYIWMGISVIWLRLAPGPVYRLSFLHLNDVVLSRNSLLFLPRLFSSPAGAHNGGNQLEAAPWGSGLSSAIHQTCLDFFNCE